MRCSPTPELFWLATDQDKVVGLTKVTSIDPDRLSHLGLGARSDARRIVAEKLPIGIDPDGRVVLLYLATDSEVGPCARVRPAACRAVALRAAWTLCIVVPPWPQGLGELYAKAVTEEVTATLRPALMSDVRRYFDERRKVAESGAGTPTGLSRETGGRPARAFAQGRASCRFPVRSSHSPRRSPSARFFDHWIARPGWSTRSRRLAVPPTRCTISRGTPTASRSRITGSSP
jgi:hypothetical protein